MLTIRLRTAVPGRQQCTAGKLPASQHHCSTCCRVPNWAAGPDQHAGRLDGPHPGWRGLEPRVQAARWRFAVGHVCGGKRSKLAAAAMVGGRSPQLVWRRRRLHHTRPALQEAGPRADPPDDPPATWATPRLAKLTSWPAAWPAVCSSAVQRIKLALLGCLSLRCIQPKY